MRREKATTGALDDLAAVTPLPYITLDTEAEGRALDIERLEAKPGSRQGGEEGTCGGQGGTRGGTCCRRGGRGGKKCSRRG